MRGKYPYDWHLCKREVERLNLAKSSWVLDVGSGDCEKAYYVFSKTKANLVLSDIKIRKPHEGYFINCDARSLPFRDGVFDLVTAFHVLEHIGGL